MKRYIILSIICLLIGFYVGRRTIKREEITRYISGETIRDTITQLIPDTVYLAGELRYKYVYKTDTIYKDVPIVDREETIKATIEDWNLNREYKRHLFNNENGKLSVSLTVRYNELQKLSYSFTPIQKQTVIRKERVFVPFVSASVLDFASFSLGGGFFYHSLGFRVEWRANRFDVGMMYKL